MKALVILFYLLTLCGVDAVFAATSVTFEAESGTLGSDFTNGTDGAVQFISIATDTVNSGNPGNANRVATYTVTFPSAGTYNLYARMQVGPGGFNDDSLFYGNGFGAKSATTDGDWIMLNGLAAGGFTAAGDVVSGDGSVGNQVWKWVNLSQFNPSGSGGETPITFTVPAGSLTQTVQIGARENGLDLDKFVFGTVGTDFTVSNLDAGTLPTETDYNTNLFVGPDGIALHRFSATINGLNLDGANPAAGLALIGNALLGTTLNGGVQGAGTVFTLALAGTNFTTFRNFTNAPDAGTPQGELSLSGNGFFGATSSGGANGTGSIYTGQPNGNVAVLSSFSTVDADTATNASGASPSGSLALSDATLYGSAIAGGTNANGVVFAMTTNDTSLLVLHQFSSLDSPTGTNADGALPQGGVILSGGTLFGTASSGGAGGNGVVFAVGIDGANFTVLHNFSPMDVLTATNADGAMPLGGLVLSGNTLYGTTLTGGSDGRGTVFSLQTDGSDFVVLHQFSTMDSVTGTNTDGASPVATLLMSSNRLFGVASAGGAGAGGTVFYLATNGAQFYVIHSFATLASNGTNAYGAFPVAPLLRVGDALFGTAFSGGPGAAGTVFSVPIPAPPAVITNVVHHPNGTVMLDFLGEPNTTNIIQSAPSLAPPVAWQPISTNVADDAGAWQFTEASTSAVRFYRSYAR